MNLLKSISAATEMVVIGHIRPDCDALGAALCLKDVADNLGIACDVLVDGGLPDGYRFLPHSECVNASVKSSYDLCIAVDCGDIFRAGRYAGFIKNSKHSVNIDHHKTNDGFAKENYVRTDASSTCEILYDLLRDSDCLTAAGAYCLYAGLSTDTGNFMHSNTTAKVLYTAARLVERFGVSPHEITDRLYRSKTKAKTALIARAISSMRFYDDDGICVISVMQKDLAETGCSLDDTEGLIDLAMDMARTQIAICLTEQLRPQFKVSFRSKGADVAKAAATFGGGGHTVAAGCIVSGYYEDVIDKLLRATRDCRDSTAGGQNPSASRR